tara:strand:+ start:2059 stop:2388 length:330 start_codon:yes stop_codon:yes gene_type:complete
MFKKILFFIFLFNILLNSSFAEENIDQWRDSNKTYIDLIEEGFEVKAYDMTNINQENGYIFMFFVTVLQKDEQIYECQEYQTLDSNLQTLNISFICRELVQPYQQGIGT